MGGVFCVANDCFWNGNLEGLPVEVLLRDEVRALTCKVQQFEAYVDFYLHSSALHHCSNDPECSMPTDLE